MGNLLSTIRVISRDIHANKAWRRYSDYAFASTTAVVPLAAAEIARAALALPLAFVQSDGVLSLAAVCGVSPGQNHFVAPNGKWAGTYIPAALRGYPFKLASLENGQVSLCFDEASGLLVDLGEAGGEPFFEADGTPAEAVRNILSFLVETNRGQQTVAAASALLHQHGVLEPWPLTVRDGDQERQVSGLLRINEAALNGLAAEAFLALRQAGALPLAYAQLLAMNNIALLGKLSQLHATYHRQQALTQAEQKAMFQTTGQGDDTIDWDKIFN